MLGTPSEGAQTQKIASSIGEWCQVQGGVQERVLSSPLLPLFLQTRENQALGWGRGDYAPGWGVFPGTTRVREQASDRDVWAWSPRAELELKQCLRCRHPV